MKKKTFKEAKVKLQGKLSWPEKLSPNEDEVFLIDNTEPIKKKPIVATIENDFEPLYYMIPQEHLESNNDAVHAIPLKRTKIEEDDITILEQWNFRIELVKQKEKLTLLVDENA